MSWLKAGIRSSGPGDPSRDVLRVIYVRKGEVIFFPVGHTLPMTSVIAHQFLEFCLSLLAEYPASNGCAGVQLLVGAQNYGDLDHASSHLHQANADMGRNIEVDLTSKPLQALISTVRETKAKEVERRIMEKCKGRHHHITEAMRRTREPTEGDCAVSVSAGHAQILPLQADKEHDLNAARAVMQRWQTTPSTIRESLGRGTFRVGFFDGDTRGNPSEERGRDCKIAWAAATSLASKTMTNDVAATIGLHRLLQYAVERKRGGFHVVGDSTLVLVVMKYRKFPKANKLQHWYRLTRRLVDLGQVKSWRHRFIDITKWWVGWLANWAMDNKESVSQVAEHDGHPPTLWRRCRILQTETSADGARR
ncbi:hypothetical protein GQ600_14775 [Phytophthora cactorum]|nr:hypothetical protein GQ600_14775 [Phytophthora cactorum]